MTRPILKQIGEMSNADWERAFPDEKSCVEWFVSSRWPQEMRCPSCSSELVFPASLHEYRWRCFGCMPDVGYPFDHLSGTLFEDSPFPLRAWLKALHREVTGHGSTYAISGKMMQKSLHKALSDPEFRRIVATPKSIPNLIRRFTPQQRRSSLEVKRCLDHSKCAM